MRKNILSAVLAFVFAIMLSACGAGSDTGNEIVDAKALADGLSSRISFSEELTDIDENALLRRYGLSADDVTEVYGYCGTRAVVDEVSVFKTDDTKKVEDQVQAHLDSQIKNYSSYAPDEVPKLEDAFVTTIGDCVIVCVSNDDAANVILTIADFTK